MIEIAADLAIIGSGFGGSMTAILADRIGLKPVLVERGSHPRFAIGESLTPQGDLTLATLARRFDLPRLLPLAKYGSWKRAYPHIACGLKRGFSYFHHTRGEQFAPEDDHANELLVAASLDEEHGDTHWFRSEFDAFLVEEVKAAGIRYLDRTELTSCAGAGLWQLEGRRHGESVRIEAPFVVNASGEAGPLASVLGITNDLSDIMTNSRSIYSHFTGVFPWQGVYDQLGGRREDHPCPADAAALHHVFDGGWMYVLRFDNGVTSAGLVLDHERYPVDPARTAEAEWEDWLTLFPSIARQFRDARPILPFVRTGRMQRRLSRMVGPNWAMLPSAACFIDPLHSSGNSHTLAGIERLVEVLKLGEGDRPSALEEYERTTFLETMFIDRIVHGCYAGFRRFELMAAFSMFYFAGAHFSEERRRTGKFKVGDAFLLSDDQRFSGLLSLAHRRVCELGAEDQPDISRIRAFVDEVAEAIGPYNLAGLCDRRKKNMYACT